MTHRSLQRKLGMVVFVAVVLALAYRPILRGSARLLVVEQPPTATTAVLVLGGDRCFEQVVRHSKQFSPSKILLLHSLDSRLTFLKILPRWEELTVRELAARGVSADRFELIPGTAHSEWQTARWLNRWLQDNPDQSVTIFCDRFESGRLHFIYRSLLAPESRDRVVFSALRDRRFDESNWWQDKAGMKRFCESWFSTLYDRLRGEDPWQWVDPNPVTYEQRLFQALKTPEGRQRKGNAIE